MRMIKNMARRSIRALGYDLKQRRPDLVDFLRSRDINVVLDVGANRGQFGARLRADGYSGSIVSFEPASEPFRELMLRAEVDEKWEAHKIALGEIPGRANLNVSMSDTLVRCSHKRETRSHLNSRAPLFEWRKSKLCA